MVALKAVADIGALAAQTTWSMLRSPERPSQRSLTTEWTFRLAKRLLSQAEHESDEWLRRRQALLRVPGPALSRVRFRVLTVAGVSCLECVPRRGGNPHQPDILYFHGGGYVVGSVDAYRYTLASLADLGQARVLAVDYRLAPEHPAPAAQDDCFAVLAQCLRNSRVPWVLMGDSAGGGLVLATWMRMTAAQRARCAGLVLLSPWLAPGDNACLTDDGSANDLISSALLSRWARSADVEQQYASQLQFRTLSALPGDPLVLVQSGELEIMRPQIATFAKALQEHGAKVEWQEYAQQFHVFQTLGPLVREAESALQDVMRWIGALQVPERGCKEN